MIEKPKLLDRLRDRIRLKHYSIRTEKAYLDWNRRFILFHNKKHPRNMGTQEVEQFLTYLAVNGRVASSTQNQALSAILFMYKEVLKIELPWLKDVTRAKRSEKIPLVFSKNEIQKLLAKLDGTNWIMAHLLYGAGLRLMECLRLRVKDIDFERWKRRYQPGRYVGLKRQKDVKISLDAFSNQAFPVLQRRIY